MGCVYEGRSPANAHVAIKMMSHKVAHDPVFRALFEAEVHTLMELNHPNVVKIVDQPYSDKEGNLYLPMEFVQGETLEHRMKRKPLTQAETLSYMVQILDAMEAVHREGKVHRDIKPSNIMIRPDQSICIIDFGIAKDSKLDDRHTVGQVVGTNGYMSPEQAFGYTVDHRTDIYSLGCLLYYMLTGTHAVKDGHNNEETNARISRGAKQNLDEIAPELPAWLRDVYQKAVQRDMRRRYQTCRAFRQALREEHEAPRPQAAANAYAVPRLSVGRHPGSDICLPSAYVSVRHMAIRGLTYYDRLGAPYFAIELADFSRNGSFVGRKHLHNATTEVLYGTTMALPPVHLGSFECLLPWAKVVRLLKAKGWTEVLPRP